MFSSLIIFLCIVLVSLSTWAMMQLPMQAGSHQSAGVSEFQSQRLLMVERQLRSRGIENEAVLQAISNVPRHRFVDPSKSI